LTPDQKVAIEVEDAAGRMAWLQLAIKEANGEQYLRPRKYRVTAKDFAGNKYVEGLARLARWNEQDPR
jgi:hypothetical protein